MFEGGAQISEVKERLEISYNTAKKYQQSDIPITIGRNPYLNDHEDKELVQYVEDGLKTMTPRSRDDISTKVT